LTNEMFFLSQVSPGFFGDKVSCPGRVEIFVKTIKQTTVSSNGPAVRRA